MNGPGRICVTIVQQGGMVRIFIRDTGPGLSADIREKIFAPFFTTSSQRRGLGLPIARRAIEHHGGSLALQSAGANGVTAIGSLPAGEYIAD